MRLASVLCIVLWSALTLEAAENKTLLAAKTQYVRQTDPARGEYIKVLDAEIARLVAAADLTNVLKLRTHRGEFLLGLKTAEEFATESAGQVGAELQTAASKFTASLSESRTVLAAAYDPAIKAALASNDVDAAARMRTELESLASGEYAPSAMEIDRQKPYDVRRTVLEPLLIFPLGDASIPDELAVDFQGQRFRVSGTCRTDVYFVNGERCGHFGKVVLIPPPRKRTQPRRGYLLVGTRESYSQYSIVVASGNRISHVLQLSDLELNTVHEWSIVVDRQELVFEISRNGEMVKSARIPGNNRTLVGFCATLRYLDTKSLLLIASE